MEFDPIKVKAVKCAVMFTDIKNSTLLWKKYPLTMLQALAEHEGLLFKTCVANGGTVLKTIGDAFMMRFESLQQAFCAATQIQMSLTNKAIMLETNSKSRRTGSESSPTKIELRIGISYGEVYEHHMKVGNSRVTYVLPDLFGSVVNIASRAESSVCATGGIAVGLPKKDGQLVDEIKPPREFKVLKKECSVYSKRRISDASTSTSTQTNGHGNGNGRSVRLLNMSASNHDPTSGSNTFDPLMNKVEIVKGIFGRDVEFTCFDPRRKLNSRVTNKEPYENMHNLRGS
jgi:hypothetical protein